MGFSPMKFSSLHVWLEQFWFHSPAQVCLHSYLSENRKTCRQTGSRESTPLLTKRVRCGNLVRPRKPHGLAKPSIYVLYNREAAAEFLHRPRIVDTDIDCGRRFCRRRFRDSYFRQKMFCSTTQEWQKQPAERSGHAEGWRNPWVINFHGRLGWHPILICLPATSQPLILLQKEAVFFFTCNFATAHFAACILKFRIRMFISL